MKTSTRKDLLLAAYCLLIPAGLGLGYLALSGKLSTPVDAILPVVYIAIILFLVRYQMNAFPNEQRWFSFYIGFRDTLIYLPDLMQNRGTEERIDEATDAGRV